VSCKCNYYTIIDQIPNLYRTDIAGINCGGTCGQNLAELQQTDASDGVAVTKITLQ